LPLIDSGILDKELGAVMKKFFAEIHDLMKLENDMEFIEDTPGKKKLLKKSIIQCGFRQAIGLMAILLMGHFTDFTNPLWMNFLILLFAVGIWRICLC